MEFAYINETNDDDINNINNLLSLSDINNINNNTTIGDNGEEPIKNIISNQENIIKINELLINILNSKEIITIDNNEYKNKKIDKIITDIKDILNDLPKLHGELDIIHEEYKKQVEITESQINQIKKYINFMTTLKDSNNEYKNINDNIINLMNELSEKILDSNKLQEVKDKYVTKRKEINSHLYLIQSINKYNIVGICPICLENKIDTYCNPCGHTACRNCLDKSSRITNNNNNLNVDKCPICRVYISDLRKLYFL